MTQPEPQTDAESTANPVQLERGQPFPAFSLPDANGHTHTLEDYRGKYLVLYIYPKDDTPGCTKEACDFRDAVTLRALGAAILGVSADDAASHTAFSEKYSLNFPLASDPGHAFIRAVGAWGTKNLYGKVSEGIKRVTFVVDPEGKLVRAWYAVKVDGHAEAVAVAIRDDQGLEDQRASGSEG